MLKSLKCLGFVLTLVFFSYATANAQIVDVTKKVVDKTKDVTVDAAKKTVEVTKDIADETKDVTVDAAKATSSGTKKIGGYVVETTGDIADKAVEAGKYYTVVAWDGTKWVAKQVWFPTKKAAKTTVDVVN